MYWLWGLFVAFVIVLLILDMGVLHRRVREVSLLEALVWSGFWITLALGLAVFIYFAYDQPGLGPPHTPPAADATRQYLSVLLIALALNLEQAFAIGLVFAHFNVALPYQVRALHWHVLYTLAWRSTVVVGAALLLDSFVWSAYVLGALALLGALRLLIRKADGADPDKHLLIKLLQHGGRIDQTARNEHFLLRGNGRWMASALLSALLGLLATETIHAISSLPALFAISMEPFVVFSATIMASLSLRSLYFVVAHGLSRLRYLRITLVLVLLILGIGLLLGPALPVSSEAVLNTVIAALALSIFASLVSSKRAEGAYMPGFAQELGRVYDITYLGLRRIVILTIGISIIIIGLLMIFTPGPAIIVIPTGLAILATEFVWARIILRKFKEQFVRYSKETKQFFERNRQRKQADNDREE